MACTDTMGLDAVTIVRALLEAVHR